MLEIVKLKDMVMQFEVHNGNATIGLMAFGCKLHRPYKATLTYPIENANQDNIDMLCKSINKVFPLGNLGKNRLKRLFKKARIRMMQERV